MTSIHTNTAAMAASETLRGIEAGLDRTQTKVSSGLRVGSASDNAAYWSISTTMKSGNMALSAASDAMAFTSAVLDTAYVGMQTVQSEMSSIRNLLIQASQMPAPQWRQTPLPYQDDDPVYDAAPQAKVTREIMQHMSQVRTAVESASFGGVNLLYMGDDSGVNAGKMIHFFVTGYVDGKVQSTDPALNSTMLINGSWVDDTKDFPNFPAAGLFDNSFLVRMKFANAPDAASSTSFFNWGAIDPFMNGDTSPILPANNFVRDVEILIDVNGAERQETWDNVISDFDGLVQRVVDRMAQVGSMSGGVERQHGLVQTQMETINKGIGRLVDADMDEASAKLKALQSQQQLGLQSLSIANNQAANVLRLYQ